jgi:uncharacterized phiE125 gp8 family phage protein
VTEYFFDRGMFGYGSVRAKSIVQVTQPPIEPVTIADIHTQARMPLYGSPLGNPEDSWIESIVLPAARQWVEAYLRRTLVQRTWRENFDQFPAVIELLMPPIVSVTSIQYIDEFGAQQTLAADQYRVDVDAEPGRIMPAFGVDQWPPTALVSNAVTVTYKAGYPTTGSPPNYVQAIPARFKQAILLIVSDLIANREKLSMMQLYDNATADALLYSDRVFTL